MVEMQVTRKVVEIRRGAALCAAICSLLLLPAGGFALAGADPQPGQPEATCELRIEGQSIERVTLSNEWGEIFEIERPGQSMLLPPGSYQVLDVRVESDGEASRYARADVDQFELTPGHPYTLRLGAPFKPIVEVARRGRTLELSYKVVDDNGRNHGLRRTDDPPSFTVFNGVSQVGSGQLEYG